MEHYRPQFPALPDYQDHIDFADPKTKRVFGRAYLSHEEMKSCGVRYMVLPQDAYGRFLEGELPPAGMPAHFRFVRNLDYVKHFFEATDRYRFLRTLRGREDGKGSVITLFEVR